jgi:outer membrane lipoprotein SlyB
MLKTATDKVKANVIGTIAGAGLTYFAVKKYTGVSKTWLVVGLAVLGGVAGAYAQSAIQAKKSTPKKDTVKK